MVAVMLSMGRWTSSLSETKRDRMQARYVAEGAIDAVRKDIQDAVANWGDPPTSGVVELNGNQVSYTVEQIAANNVSVNPSGIQTIVDTYEVETRAIVDGARYTARRMVSTDATPLFQFAVFYNQDLEISPGPSMTLAGRVHSNADMYLTCGNSSTLTVDTNYLRANGQILRRRKIDDVSRGRVDVRRWVADPYDSSEPREFVEMFNRGQLDDLGVTSPNGYDSLFAGWDANLDGDFFDDGDWLPFIAGALEFWSQPDDYGETGNTVLSGEHGVSEAAIPPFGSIEMFESAEGGNYAFVEDSQTYERVADGTGDFARGHFHDEADLSFLVSYDADADTYDWTAYDLDGFEVTPDEAMLNAVQLSEIYDAREGGSDGTNTPVIQIDMGLLGRSVHYPDNGLIYAAHYGLQDQLGGVQLVNGATLADATTVVSAGSLYIEGDYNTRNRTAAAVIADAVNLLSNNWDGTKSAGSLPSASETTYNVAVITGNYETQSGDYNGGLENLPRFHENWSGIDCNISGSFVNLWESRYATGRWGIGGDRYRAPRRNWEYDTSFNSVGNLPPFTPLSVSARDVVSW